MMALRVLVAGLGGMGRSHALAYHRHPGFEIAGLVNRPAPRLSEEFARYAIRPDYVEALRALRPDVVSINTYSDTHADYAVMASEQGEHLYLAMRLDSEQAG